MQTKKIIYFKDEGKKWAADINKEESGARNLIEETIDCELLNNVVAEIKHFPQTTLTPPRPSSKPAGLPWPPDHSLDHSCLKGDIILKKRVGMDTPIAPWRTMPSCIADGVGV